MDPVTVAPSALRRYLPLVWKAAAHAALLAAAIPPPTLSVAIPPPSVVFWEKAMWLRRPRDGSDTALTAITRMGERGAVVDQCPARPRGADPVVGAANKNATVGDVRCLLASPLIAAYTYSLAASLVTLEASCTVLRPCLGPPRPRKSAGQAYPIFAAATARIAAS